MAAWHQRMQETCRGRFGKLLVAWLATLPRKGWVGRNDALGAALDELNEAGKFYTYVPWKGSLSKAVMSHQPEIEAAGFTLSFPRTAAARLIKFARRRKR